MKRLYLLLLVIITAMLLAACNTTTSEAPLLPSKGDIGQAVPVDGGGQYLDITPQELKTMLEKKDFFFVNVHIPYEGELPETDAFIPFDEIEGHLAEFPQEKDAKIVLYCRSGSMSATAAREMVRLGYTNIYNLDGGFRAWEEAGYEFIP
jgi:rhodanese-related sulfurtransferase